MLERRHAWAGCDWAGHVAWGQSTGLAGNVTAKAGVGSEHRQVTAELVFGDLAAVLLPFRAFVAQEKVEDVLA
jgi:hypothetical protein